MHRPEFLEQLRQSKLLSDEQLADALARFPDGTPMHEMTAALVELGLLTAYQINRLWSGQSKGLVLGQYRILEELGRGGFGRVYKAVHRFMNRTVALKVVNPDLLEDDEARAMFRREILAANQLNHPNIVMAYDANEDGDTLFLVMEYVEGQTLHQLVRSQGPLPIGLGCAMLQQAARALQFAHELGMVHRDIKPLNMLIPRDTTSQLTGGAAALAPSSKPLIKIMDFGLARLRGKGTASGLTLQKDKGFMGTPDYVSPEQARNVHDVDIRSDLYSLGCSFYFAFAGQPPFKGGTALETIVQHLEGEAEPLEKCRPEMPAALASVIRRLMAKEPAQRFQGPADVVAELAFLFGGAAMLAPVPPTPTPVLSVPPIVERRPVEARSAAATETFGARRAANLLVKTTLLPHAPPDEARIDPPGAPPSAARFDDSAVALPVVVGHVSPETRDRNTKPPTQREFAELWREWTMIIERVMRRQTAGVAEATYRRLHERLCTAARALAQHVESQQRESFRKAVTILEPWVTLQALAATDRENLASLYQACRQVDIALGIGRRGWSAWHWAAVAALFLLVGGLGTFAFQMLSRQRFSLQSAWALLEANPVVAMVVVVPLLVLGSFLVFARLRA